MFKIIINCGPCERFISYCLKSVRMQSIQNWEAYVTMDAPGDKTIKTILANGSDSRIHIRLNKKRVYSLANQVHSIESSGDCPEDIIVSLDGDDWFTGSESLAIIKNTYDRTSCWMTYGSWVSYGGPAGKGLWPPYPEGITNFRQHQWLGTAVRTWKRWLWNRINKTDLQDEKGRWFCIAEDRAIMIPLLEMCGTSKARHISDPIMWYNQSPIIDYSMQAEAMRVLDITRGRIPYAPIIGIPKYHR